MTKATLPLSKDQLISDYRLAYRSRQAAIIGRREVLTGKAKFGIFGDGKELPQLAIAHCLSKRRLALGLLPRPDLDVRSRSADPGAVLCAAVRAYRSRLLSPTPAGAT